MSRNKQQAPAPVRTQTRCAIYTRKSTEEGLEQEFNSLDAQRESGEAYIKSQQHEGWTCIPEHYDDGGFTGANMERPALRRLLADIQAGKVDCVVVYKVDRLSRSLLDFGRLMEKFNQHSVAFVSVTQAFNTASSMGRLILNILLSFAQFEREMISERTRDKIAAARRKGKWSGGMPILGYGVEKTKLVINAVEVVLVQEIFRLYLELRSILAVAKEINDRGWRTKQWTTKKGVTRGGHPFNKTSLYQLLTNVAYTGKVRYKSEVHNGEHEAIIDVETFEKVQTLLNHNGASGGRTVRNKHNALLRGLLHCDSCNCTMGHSYCTKGSQLYRYYVCQHAQKNGWQYCPAPSLSAGEIENFVVDQIKCIGRDPALIRDTLAQARRQVEDRLERLDSERVALNRQLRDDVAILAQAAQDKFPAADSRPLESQSRIATAERRLAEIGDEAAKFKETTISESDIKAAFSDFERLWETLLPKEQGQILELLIERVAYDGRAGKLSITYRPTGIHTLGAQTTNWRNEEAA